MPRSAAASLVTISRRLAKDVDALRFAAPVQHVYNPLRYARRPHEAYLKRWGTGRKEVLLIGMNPGPFGMAQTGVPFGDVGFARDWLQVSAPVASPPRQHPKRPIQGFDCSRSEVSGSRLWGWARDRFVTPERFFDRFFVANYCPLVFMEESGRNRTPDKLPKPERALLFAACDAALRATVRVLEPRIVVGVGAFARRRAEEALTDVDVEIGVILHPSPASPAANRGWAPRAEADFAKAGISL
jgi:single-strand selective monofunctional uracil DNA glycosylase